MTAPVALFVFSDSDRVTRVLREIRRFRPRRLFLVADGPHADDADEARRCTEARVTAGCLVDWDCEVYRNFSDTHLGPAARTVTGLSWLFEQAEEAIILDDGSVPHPSFFPFCSAMLERYREDERVMHVNGVAEGRTAPLHHASYSFTDFNDVHGWATWRRAWRHFDVTVGLWPHFRSTRRLHSLFAHRDTARSFFEASLERAFRHPYNPPQLEDWVPQWAFACWSHHALGIVPSASLVHAAPDPQWLERHLLPRELVHPPFVLKDVAGDLRYLEEILVPRIAARRPLLHRGRSPAAAGFALGRKASSAAELAEAQASVT